MSQEFVFEVQKNYVASCIEYLKNCIYNENLNGIKFVLSNIFIPDCILTYQNMHQVDEEILRILLASKIAEDKFVTSLIVYIEKTYADFNDGVIPFSKSVVRIEVMLNISRKQIYFPSKTMDYQNYMLLNLLRDSSNVLTCSKIYKTYRTVTYIVGQLYNESIYYANPTFHSTLTIVCSSLKL